MEIITSVNNQRVKDTANLKQKKYREETGTFFAEGLRAVTEAVQYADVTDLFFIKAEESRLNEIMKRAEEKFQRSRQRNLDQCLIQKLKQLVFS